MDDSIVAPARGLGLTLFREVRCKDCLREDVVHSSAPSDEASPPLEGRFEYSEAWATRLLDRGGSRSDRCSRHRREHRDAIQGIAVAYVTLVTIGEVADRSNPSGPLGGLGELPTSHRAKSVEVDLSHHAFGMTDDHIRAALQKLGDERTRVLVLKAGTGTGKSTFAPYRLLNPPRDRPGDEQLLQLTKLGPIIVTEPRVQATTGVARYVGEKLVANCNWKVCDAHGRFVPSTETDLESSRDSQHPGPLTDTCIVSDCSEHIGPGFPVGYQTKGDKKHDDSCQLIYVTDGTMVNWLREGRLGNIGAVIVDEAHERSVNIDFIMGELRRQLPRYPHLRVIVTSATFDVDFYVDFFGGRDVVASMDVPAAKAFGYGSPLFPYSGDDSVTSACPPCACPPVGLANPHVDPHNGLEPVDLESWIQAHWHEQRPEVRNATSEDIWETTRQLETLRYAGKISMAEWRTEMPAAVARQVIRMVNGLDVMRIPGDILAFLPSEKMIREAVSMIRQEVDPRTASVFGLLGTMPKEDQQRALAAAREGSPRKVVVATNVAETSLTVEGVRFVVDSGLITQSTWDPVSASGNVPTQVHSQSGVRQRWGRVGRTAPGWVFPLYTVEQFQQLPLDTPPGSTRENLEKLVMTAKAGGVDNIDDFPWPARHSFGNADESALVARGLFAAELTRAGKALAMNGVVDSDGDLTHFGKGMQRLSISSPATTALATMFADQLACVPEVVTALALLDVTSLFGGDGGVFLHNRTWSLEVRTEANVRRAALRAGCTDDLDLVIRMAAGWDRCDPEIPPWEVTERRLRWCQAWWLNDKVLLRAAEVRREALSELSPAMKEEVKRLIDPRLTERTRSVLSRALTSLQYSRRDDGKYQSRLDPSLPPAAVSSQAVMSDRPDLLLAMRREKKETLDGETVLLKHLVRVLPWAADESLDAFGLLELAARHASPRVLPRLGVDPILPYTLVWPAGMRFEGHLRQYDGQVSRLEAITRIREPLLPPVVIVSVPEDLVPPERSAGESNWLLGTATPDEEDVLRRALDTTDDPIDPEKGLEANDDDSTSSFVEIGETVDYLAEWEQAAEDADLNTPKVTGIEGEGTAYGCIGYSFDSLGDVTLVLASAIYSIELSIRAEDRGRVFGKGHETIRGLQSRDGVLACEFLDDDGRLGIIGTSHAAVSAVLDELFSQVLRQARQCRGVMTMPSADDRKRIIGREGKVIQELKERSGCTGAQCQAGAKEWTLLGPTAESIEEFIELASARVPGCYGEITNSGEIVVHDRISGEDVTTWEVGSFSGATTWEWPDFLAPLPVKSSVRYERTGSSPQSSGAIDGFPGSEKHAGSNLYASTLPGGRLSAMAEDDQQASRGLDPIGSEVREAPVGGAGQGGRRTPEWSLEALRAEYPLGSVLTGPVRKIEHFGIKVRLRPGLNGLVHKSKMGKLGVGSMADRFRLQEEVKVEIIGVDLDEKAMPRIALAMRDESSDSAGAASDIGGLSAPAPQNPPHEDLDRPDNDVDGGIMIVGSPACSVDHFVAQINSSRSGQRELNRQPSESGESGATLSQRRASGPALDLDALRDQTELWRRFGTESPLD